MDLCREGRGGGGGGKSFDYLEKKVNLTNSNISIPYTNADLNFILYFSFLFSIIIICEIKNNLL